MSTENLTESEKIIRELKKQLNIRTDSELASILGYSSSGTISMWKKRNRVDYQRIIEYVPDIDINRLKNIDFNSSENIEPPGVVRDPGTIYQLIDQLPSIKSGQYTAGDALRMIELAESILRSAKEALKRLDDHS